MDSLTYIIRNLHFGYSSTNVLRGIDLTFEPGKLHAIVGPNGSGKSTLLDILAGHRVPASGDVLINNIPISDHTPSALAKLTAIVPQEFDFNFPFTVFDTVLMGRHPHIPRFSRPSDVDIDMVQTALTTMDIAQLANRTLAELSGGEKQRTIFARALVQDTSCLLLDEPTSSMDIRHALSTMTELTRLAHEGRTVIAVLHDLNLAASYCDRIIILDNGQMHKQGSIEETLTPETIQAVFGVTADITRKPQSDNLIISFDSKDHS